MAADGVESRHIDANEVATETGVSLVQGLFALEAIARAARQAGDWDLAERAARRMLEHDPAYAGTQYAWALVTDRRGDRDAARSALTLAQTYWSRADPDLPELADVRTRLAALGGRR